MLGAPLAWMRGVPDIRSNAPRGCYLLGNEIDAQRCKGDAEQFAIGDGLFQKHDAEQRAANNERALNNDATATMRATPVA